MLEGTCVTRFSRALGHTSASKARRLPLRRLMAMEAPSPVADTTDPPCWRETTVINGINGLKTAEFSFEDATEATLASLVLGFTCRDSFARTTPFRSLHCTSPQDDDLYSSMLEFRCNRCWNSNFADVEDSGTECNCRHCGQTQTIPEATEARIARAMELLAQSTESSRQPGCYASLR